MLRFIKISINIKLSVMLSRCGVVFLKLKLVFEFINIKLFGLGVIDDIKVNNVRVVIILKFIVIFLF